MTDDWGRVVIDDLIIVTSRALCGKPTFEVRGENCRYAVRDRNGDENIAVIEREQLFELVPALRPSQINFACVEDEYVQLAALVAELRAELDIPAEVLH